MFKLIFTLLLLTWSAFSWSSECRTASGSPYQYTYNFGTKTVTDPNQNKAGQTFTNAYSWNLGGDYTGYCYCSGSFRAIYYSTQTDLAQGHNYYYYKVNDNLEVSTQIYIGGGRMQYVQTPFNSESNYDENYVDRQCSQSLAFSSGSKGILSLYISKPFIGNSSFSARVLSLYGDTSTSGHGSTPLSQVFINGSVVVPQNCTINAGQTITVDFGTMLSSAFKSAGEKPTGMTDKVFNVPIKCANVDGTANLALRVTATPASGNANAIASNNADVGVVVTSEQGNVLTPNNANSKVPFNVDSSGNASVTLKAYPISTTGKQPKEGLFTALATLVIDFA